MKNSVNSYFIKFSVISLSFLFLSLKYGFCEDLWYEKYKDSVLPLLCHGKEINKTKVVGTAFLYKPGYFMTDAHNFRGCDTNEIYVCDINSKKIKITSIDYSKEEYNYDIAFLKVQDITFFKNRVSLPLDMDKRNEYTHLLYMGFLEVPRDQPVGPDKLEGSGKWQENFTIPGGQIGGRNYNDVIIANIAAGTGYSGGPVIDQDSGKVVGIMVATDFESFSLINTMHKFKDLLDK